MPRKPTRPKAKEKTDEQEIDKTILWLEEELRRLDEEAKDLMNNSQRPRRLSHQDDRIRGIEPSF
ncbi:MAG TPA: hypothetical protein VLE47_01625 [Candidatus Saccharimonadales bacterium]|nr:hypothetical protein [Candidatus Saccharimonadales bacterium]